MWNAISSMIIKAADNMNRGAENAATSSGEGSNGQDYQISSGVEDKGSAVGTGGGGYTPSEQDMSGAEKAQSSIKGVTDIAKTAVSNIGQKEEKTEGEEEEKSAGGIGGAGAITSDERLKRIFGENPDAIKCFSKLESIKFTYNDKAKEIHPEGENGVDNDTHYGVKAQELEENPYTKSAVSEDAEGFKQIDPKELTAANTAVISEICRRLLLIEKVLGLEVK